MWAAVQTFFGGRLPRSGYPRARLSSIGPLMLPNWSPNRSGPGCLSGVLGRACSLAIFRGLEAGLAFAAIFAAISEDSRGPTSTYETSKVCPKQRQVHLPPDVKSNVFKAVVRSFETRVNLGWAVLSCSADLRNRIVSVFWSKAVKYNTAMSWVNAGFEDARFEAKFYPTPEDRQETSAMEGPTSGTTAAASASASDPLSASRGSGYNLPPAAAPPQASPLPAVVATRWRHPADDESGPPPASKKATPVTRREVPQTGDHEEGVSGGWLVIKALELLRGSPACPKAAGLNELVVGERLGEGSFGTVRVCTQPATGMRFARKKLKEADKKEFLHEIGVLSRLRHKNVVALVDVSVQPDLCLVLKYAGADLASLLHSGSWLRSTWECVFAQILDGLSYTHSRFVVHGDFEARQCLLRAKPRDRYDR